MKLLLSVVEDRAAGRVVDALVAGGFGVTRIDTAGGFFRRGNATLLVGADEERVDAAIAVMRAAYPTRAAASDGDPGGPLFVLDVASFARV